MSAFPYISLYFFTFLNAFISVKTSLINTKLGDLVNLGVLFLTMWINFASPIIYSLVPGSSWYESGQFTILAVQTVNCILIKEEQVAD